MSNAPTFVGIDLGTTYSAVAYLNNHGKVEIIPNDRSQPVTPSIVMFPDEKDEEPIVGTRAKSLARMYPDRVIEHVKRSMGDTTVEYEVDGEVYTPEDISAIILRELRKYANIHLNRPVTDAVITVPAYFDDGERTATRLAGELAGFNVMGILNEPTAAALAFGLDHAVSAGRALIYDLGGGTFDVTVVDVDGGHIDVLATDGVRQLGGVDWNAKLTEYVAHEFMVKFGPDPREDLKSAQRLADEIEAAKRSLSSKKRAKLFIECGDRSGSVLVTRQKFEDLTEGLLLQTEAYTEAVLEKADLTWKDIDRILLAGGSTRMPMVRSMLKNLSGMDPDTSLNPDECVAIGACYYASKLQSEGKGTSGTDILLDHGLMEVAQGIQLRDVVSHSIGIQSVVGGTRQNVKMIEEQSKLPAEVTRYFATHADNQVTVQVKVLEGESEDPEDCRLLGNAVIRDLPPQRPRGSKIAVTYKMPEDGILTVFARDVDSGKSCSATIHRGVATEREQTIDVRRKKIDALYMLEGETADDEYDSPRRPGDEETGAFDRNQALLHIAQDQEPPAEFTHERRDRPSTMQMKRLESDLVDIVNQSPEPGVEDTGRFNAGEQLHLVGGEVAAPDDYDEYPEEDDFQSDEEAGVTGDVSDDEYDDEADEDYEDVGQDQGHEQDMATTTGEISSGGFNPWAAAAEEGLLGGDVSYDDEEEEEDEDYEDEGYEDEDDFDPSSTDATGEGYEDYEDAPYEEPSRELQTASGAYPQEDRVSDIEETYQTGDITDDSETGDQDLEYADQNASRAFPSSGPSSLLAEVSQDQYDDYDGYDGDGYEDDGYDEAGYNEASAGHDDSYGADGYGEGAYEDQGGYEDDPYGEGEYQESSFGEQEDFDDPYGEGDYQDSGEQLPSTTDTGSSALGNTPGYPEGEDYGSDR